VGSIQWAVGSVFHSTESRAGESRETGRLWQSRKNDQTILFRLKTIQTRLPTRLFTGGPRGEKAFDFPTNPSSIEAIP